MEIIGLKHRRTFMLNYVEPAIKKGVVALLYPNSPRHPRQKYKLTVKGLALLHDLMGDSGQIVLLSLATRTVTFGSHCFPVFPR